MNFELIQFELSAIKIDAYPQLLALLPSQYLLPFNIKCRENEKYVLSLTLTVVNCHMCAVRLKMSVNELLLVTDVGANQLSPYLDISTPQIKVPYP